MNDSFERVKDAINLVQYVERQGLTVKREGVNHKTRCLWHDDTNPSLVLYDDGGYKCFACQASGDVFNFAEKFHGWTKAEALIELARYAGITLEPLSAEHAAKQGRRERLYALMEHVVKFFQKHLYDNDDALDYLCGIRKLSLETIEQAQMGYAPYDWQRLYAYLKSCDYAEEEMIAAGVRKRNDKGETYDFFRGRIIVPIKDHKGRVVSFGGRTIGEVTNANPKYLNGPETEIFSKSKIIYGLDATGGAGATGTRILVEGYMDVLQARKNGLYDVVACMGVGLSDEQLTLLCANGITRLVFCLDNDVAGHTALRRHVEKHMHTAADKGVDLYAMTIPHGKDADDTLREHPELWQPAVDAARHVTEVLIDRTIASLDPFPTPAQLSKMARDLLPILKSSNPYTQKTAIEYLADQTDIPYSDLKAWLEPIHILPKHINAPMHLPKYPNLPSVELIVLHGILVNEDPQMWLDRANITLEKLPYPKACGPLSQNDFTDERTRGVMAMVTAAVSNGIRPFDSEVQMQIGNGPLHEVYYRATCAPDVQAVFASHDNRPPFTLSYDDFLKHVYRLRALRLKADITRKLIPGTDLVEWTRARLHLEQLSVKGWAI